MPGSHLSANQADAHRSIQPAGTFCQSGQEGLGQQEAFSAGSYRTEAQSASFVALVQHYTPGIGWSLLTVPVQDSDKLFPQRIDDEWRWHDSDQRWKGIPQRPGRGAVRPVSMQNMGQPPGYSPCWRHFPSAFTFCDQP